MQAQGPKKTGSKQNKVEETVQWIEQRCQILKSLSLSSSRESAFFNKSLQDIQQKFHKIYEFIRDELKQRIRDELKQRSRKAGHLFNFDRLRTVHESIFSLFEKWGLQEDLNALINAWNSELLNIHEAVCQYKKMGMIERTLAKTINDAQIKHIEQLAQYRKSLKQNPDVALVPERTRTVKHIDDAITLYLETFKKLWQREKDPRTMVPIVMMSTELRAMLLNNLSLENPDDIRLAESYRQGTKAARKAYRHKKDKVGQFICLTMTYNLGATYTYLAKGAMEGGDPMKARYLMTIAMGHFHAIKDGRDKKVDSATLFGSYLLLNIELDNGNMNQIKKHLTNMIAILETGESIDFKQLGLESTKFDPKSQKNDLNHAVLLKGLDALIKYEKSKRTFLQAFRWQSIKIKLLMNKRLFKVLPKAVDLKEEKQKKKEYQIAHWKQIKSLLAEHEISFDVKGGRSNQAEFSLAPDVYKYFKKMPFMKKLTRERRLIFNDEKIEIPRLIQCSKKQIEIILQHVQDAQSRVEQQKAQKSAAQSKAQESAIDQMAHRVSTLSLGQASPTSRPAEAPKRPKVKTRGTPDPLLFQSKKERTSLSKKPTVGSKGFVIDAGYAQMGLTEDTPIQQCRDSFGGKNPYFIVYLDHGRSKIHDKIIQRFKSTVFSDPKIVTHGQGIKIWTDAQGHVMPVGKIKGAGQGNIRALPVGMIQNRQKEVLVVFDKTSLKNTKTGPGHAHYGKKRRK